MDPNQMGVNCSAVLQEHGPIGDGSMATLPVKVMRVLTTMKCAISSPAKDLHLTAHSGSIPAFTGLTVSKGLLRVTGM